MGKIMNMEIANAVSTNKDIQITSSMFGLIEKAIYLPTNSKLRAFSKDYTVDEGNKLADVMNKNVEDMKSYLEHNGVAGSVAIGNVRVEGCFSVDGQFVLYQWFRFVDFQYQALSSAIVFKGENVSTIRQLLQV